MRDVQGWRSHPLTIVAATFFVWSALAPMPAGAQAQAGDKWLTVVLPAEPPDLDGCQSARQHQGRVVKQNIVETLVQRNPTDFALTPRLATSWERLDESTWRLKLRQGVTFHDGTPFNAKSAKWAMERTILTPSLACSDKSKGFTGFSIEITAIDEYTLQIKTSKPEPILLMKLANLGIVGPNTLPDKYVLNPVGTGPYVFDGWQAGQQIVLKRNEKYWGAKPSVEGVRYVWRDDSSVRASMVKIGEADIALAIAEQDATDPKMDFSHLNSDTLALRIDTASPPLNDRRVRLALNYAVDRRAPVGSILPKTTLDATQIIVPAIPGHNHAIDKKLYPYDPAKAKQLLAEARAEGVPVDNEILLISYPSNFPNAGELMEAYFTMFKAVGLNMKLLTVEPGQYAKWNTRPFPEPRVPFILQSLHDNLSGDPVFSIQKYRCDGSTSGYCDPEFDKETNRVSNLSGDARVAAWNEVFRTLYEDIVPDVMLYHMVGFTRVGPRVKYIPDVATNNEIRVEEITFN